MTDPLLISGQMVTLAPFVETDRRALLEVRVSDEQAAFSGQPDEAFAPECAHMDIHVIRLGDRIVGMFRIDPTYSATYPFADTTDIGLRMFIVDVRVQGKGVGTGACLALSAYLRAHYQASTRVVLTVDEGNTAGRAVYTRAGFDQWPDRSLGGQHRPQIVTSMDLAGPAA